MPLLIAFEGIDGSGKTTQSLLLKAELDRLLYSCVITKAKQPHQNEVFHRFIESFDISFDSIAFMFAYQALHRKQYEITIKALQSGCSVIADRWDSSFFVYHSLFGPLAKKPESVRVLLNKLAFERLEPQITFLLDVPPQTANVRLKKRGETGITNFAFYESICKQYYKLAKQKNWTVIDKNRSIEEIHNIVLSTVLERIGQD